MAVYAATGLGLFFPLFILLVFVWGFTGPGYAEGLSGVPVTIVQIVLTLPAVALVVYVERRLVQIDARDWWLGAVVAWPWLLLLGAVVSEVPSKGWAAPDVLWPGPLMLGFAYVCFVGPPVIIRWPRTTIGGRSSNRPRRQNRRTQDSVAHPVKRMPSPRRDRGSPLIRAVSAPAAGPPADVRPDWSGRSSAAMTAFLGGCVIVVAVSLIVVPLAAADRGMGNAWIIDIPITAGVGIALSAGLLYVRNERVGFLNGSLFRVTAFGRSRSWRMSELSEVIRVHILVGGWTSSVWDMETGLVDADLVVNNEGRAVASFTGWWRPDALTSLWAATGLPIHEPWRKPVTVQEVRASYPGAVPWLPLTGDHTTTGREWLVFAVGCLGAAILVVMALALMAAFGTRQTSQ